MYGSWDVKMNEILELKGIKKAFGGVPVLNGIDLSVKPGEFITLLGSSGCGKTTTLRIISGLETPDSGTVLLEGADVTGTEPDKRGVHTVFQNYALFPHMTVEANIGYSLKIRGVKKTEIKSRVREMLELVQLEGFGGRMPGELSGGQRQRVGIARALSDTPQVLLCDEPTSALDPESTRAILSLLRQVRDETGVTIVIITHEMSVVREICDSVTLLKNGGIVQSGTIEEVLADPGSPLAKELVPAPSVDELDVTDFNRELTEREIAAQSDSAEDDTPAQASEEGNILLDVIFTSHPGVPTGSNMLNLAAKVGADVTAGTFESMGSVQVGRLALAVPAAQRSSIIDQLRAQGAHVEVRSL